MINSIYRKIKEHTGIVNTVFEIWLDFFICLVTVFIFIYIILKMKYAIRMKKIKENKKISILLSFILFVSFFVLIIEGIKLLKFNKYEFVTSSGIIINDFLIILLLLFFTSSLFIYSVWYLKTYKQFVSNKNKRFAVYSITVSLFITIAGIFALIRCLKNY